MQEYLSVDVSYGQCLRFFRFLDNGGNSASHVSKDDLQSVLWQILVDKGLRRVFLGIEVTVPRVIVQCLFI